jgi:hypothetical protein
MKGRTAKHSHKMKMLHRTTCKWTATHAATAGTSRRIQEKGDHLDNQRRTSHKRQTQKITCKDLRCSDVEVGRRIPTKMKLKYKCVLCLNVIVLYNNVEQVDYTCALN